MPPGIKYRFLRFSPPHYAKRCGPRLPRLSRPGHSARPKTSPAVPCPKFRQKPNGGKWAQALLSRPEAPAACAKSTGVLPAAEKAAHPAPRTRREPQAHSNLRPGDPEIFRLPYPTQLLPHTRPPLRRPLPLWKPWRAPWG